MFIRSGALSLCWYKEALSNLTSSGSLYMEWTAKASWKVETVLKCWPSSFLLGRIYAWILTFKDNKEIWSGHSFSNGYYVLDCLFVFFFFYLFIFYLFFIFYVSLTTYMYIYPKCPTAYKIGDYENEQAQYIVRHESRWWRKYYQFEYSYSYICITNMCVNFKLRKKIYCSLCINNITRLVPYR